MENQILKLVGHRIRDIRKQKGLTQEQLGELAGFHFSYIGGIERAEKNVSLLNLQKIANSLQVQTHELFLFEKNLRSSKGEKEILMNQINELLWPLDKKDIKKVKWFITEIIEEN
ncbi:helix-turn-helix domain-containing protein [Paenibacillus eucommiae]|uniref:Transcriptional regulator with XRE-family HTH domain n=1 Tax=Paenibacillus eucommiae TaxID=1355755 RepID=A0ABS4IUC9_9BACL|nr:helix-turn-helix transcriptional regulator [Paenibacillus eucommiae]MBP1991185.1 transcriptional regulator with XRE-family HTH domain [Paenibacillus eucommiae]